MLTDPNPTAHLEVARTLPELARTLAGRDDVGLVPTMGALHDGHRALLDAARRTSRTVVMSLFVNPTQFAPGEDLDRYPRDEDGDLAIASQAGADIVFAPDVDIVYPPGFSATVDPGPLGDELEGAARPGHLRGVSTVVTRLFGLVRPTRAFFGEKDYQQLTVVRSVVRDLALGVEIVGVPTVRSPDGLALSSRNVYLSPSERRDATTLHAGLRAAAPRTTPASALPTGCSRPRARRCASSPSTSSSAATTSRPTTPTRVRCCSSPRGSVRPG